MEESRGKWIRNVFASRFMAIIVLCVLLFAPFSANAQVVFELPACTQSGNCQIPDAVNTLIAIAEFIFGIVGSLTLIMFIYGGFVWITSGGSESRITEGKTILRNAVVGLLIVFLAGAAIQFVLSSLDVGAQYNLLQGKAPQTVVQ